MTATKPKGRSYLFGTPIAWIAAYGALVGVTSLVPILPYAGGGGYWPLATPLATVAPLILGPIGGFIAAFVGGIIGMFIAPPAYPLGIVDAFFVTAMPAIMVGLALNTKKYWMYFLGVTLLATVVFFIVLFYYPGVSGGWAPVPIEMYIIGSLYYWLLPLAVLLSPIGTKYIYGWSRSTAVNQRFIGIFLGAWMGMNAWYITPSLWLYWILFEFPSALLYLMVWGIYSWYMPLFALIITFIAAPITEALRRSGMAKPPDVLW